MNQTCIKCGHVQVAADAVPAVACSKCGAIYAKVRQTMTERAAAADSRAAGQTARGPVVAPWLTTFAVAAVGVAAYVVYDTGRSNAERQARDQQRVEQRRASETEARRRAELVRNDQAERRARQEADRRAAMTPAEVRREKLHAQFSPWDGSHRATEQAILAHMNNPKSYEHVVTTTVDRGIGRGTRVTTKFRGTNSFNAVVVSFAVAEVDESGKVTALKFVR